jgi:CRP-like cAMP-binding protein
VYNLLQQSKWIIHIKGSMKLDKLELLKRSELFRELNNEQLGLVVPLCTGQVYEPGAIIHKANAIINKIYVIEAGLVGIILEPGPLSQRQLQAVSNFETFGWEAAIPPHLATATAKAIEKTRVLAFDGNELCNLCFAKPEVGCIICRAVARVIAGRLHSAFMQLVGITSQD